MHDLSIPDLFLILAAMLIAAKLFGELAERFGQPAVLGELVAGVLLGGSVLGIVPVEGPAAEIVHVLAELGVVLLLFEIGLETDLKQMFRVGAVSLSVATLGVVLPFLLGFLYWAYAPHPGGNGSGDLTAAAVFVGATLTATSVGITARVLSDLGRMHTQEARIIIGAAVIDDVIGLVILTVVSAMAAGRSPGTLDVLRVAGIAVGFLVIAVGAGRYLVPRLFDLVVRMRVRYVLLVFAVAFALGLSAVASLAGSALIIGAFAAGIILSGTNQFDTIAREVRPVASIFTPIFFVSVGASVNLRLLDPAGEGSAGILGVAAAITALAVAGKVAAGWAAPWVKFRRLVVGVGMVPRGEVGLIFADIGRRSGILNEAVFGAILLMVMATTFLALPGLKLVFGSSPSESAES
ncbi:MAG TPA: cation:proton antiporter [Gemmatimonadales bacterium]|nr:cation:proton antiporter [Gemmatimonadales bacterium]